MINCAKEIVSDYFSTSNEIQKALYVLFMALMHDEEWIINSGIF